MGNGHFIESTKSFEHKVSYWNQNTFGDIFHRKRKILARLKGLQSSIHYPTSGFLQSLEVQLSNKFSEILKLKEEF